MAEDGRPGLLPPVSCPVILRAPLRCDHAPQTPLRQLAHHLRRMAGLRDRCACKVTLVGVFWGLVNLSVTVPGSGLQGEHG